MPKPTQSFSSLAREGCRQIGQPVPAMLFDSAGQRDPDGFPIALLNLANRVGRKMWSVDIKAAPPSELTLVLADQRPWAHGSALARCAILMAAGGATDVYGLSDTALNETVAALSGLAWWAGTLGDSDPVASAQARTWCVAILTRAGIEASDPGDLAARHAIAEILTTVSIGGHA
jgi:hypothetical protein